MKRNSSVLVISGMLVSGLSGYVLNWLVPSSIGFEEYLHFAIFWSVLFLTISALSGVQQEVTRATTSVIQKTRGHSHLFAGFLLATIVAAVSLISFPFWSLWAFPRYPENYGMALVAGAILYIFLAVAMGLFYGAKAWLAIFVATVVEGITRLLIIIPILQFSASQFFLPWAVVIPFCLGLICGLLVYKFGTGSRQKYELDVGLGKLISNSLATVGAALFMGLMISGFPAVLELASFGFSKEKIGLYVAMLTLLRAPFVILLMAMQSYLISLFKESQNSTGIAYKLVIIVISCGLGFSVLSGFFGVEVTRLLFPDNAFYPSTFFYVCLVLSSVFIAILCVIGPFVLARGQHAIYLAGWAVGAFLTILILIQNWDFELKLNLAISVPPIFAIGIQLILIMNLRKFGKKSLF